MLIGSAMRLCRCFRNRRIAGWYENPQLRDINRYENDYRDNPFEEELVVYRHKKTLESLDRHQARHVLEVGCGLVPLYRYYDRFLTLTIVEPASGFAEDATKHAPEGVTVINDFLGSRQKQPEMAFDFIVISSLLHEHENPMTLLRTAMEFAGPDTILHINVPNARSMHRVLALRMGLIDSLVQKSERQIQYQQHQTFDMDSIKALMDAAGLDVLHQETFFIKPFSHGQMQELLDLGFMSRRMLDGLSLLSEDLPDMGAEIVVNARLKQT